MALLLLPFLPASGVLLRVGFVIAERYSHFSVLGLQPSCLFHCRVLYMPSLGFCLLVAIGSRRLGAACPKVILTLALYHRNLAILIPQVLAPFLHSAMALLVVATAAKTVSRNQVSIYVLFKGWAHVSIPLQDWGSDLVLFTAGVRVNPDNVKLRNNLGMELKSAGRLEEAQHQYLVCRFPSCSIYHTSILIWFQMSMKIDPEYGEVYFNYGNVLSDIGDYKKAIVL